MDSYNLSYTLNPEQGKILSGLARRCRDINSWGPQELLQYAATANSQAELELKLDFLQDAVTHLEIVNSTQAKKDAVRITEEERAVCRRVADAFTEMYSLDLMVLDAGQYGFVKLQYYKHHLMNKTERIRQGGSPIIGFNIRLRELKHLRNMNLAAKLQLEGVPISTSSLSKIEQGACNPTTAQLVALREILGCDYSYFFSPC